MGIPTMEGTKTITIKAFLKGSPIIEAKVKVKKERGQSPTWMKCA